MSYRETHWTEAQRERLIAALEEQERGAAVVAYRCTDAHGRPANGGSLDVERAAPGVRWRLDGEPYVDDHGIHGTLTPHRWAGVRVWICVWRGAVDHDVYVLAGCDVECIGEILPDEVVDPSVAARIDARESCLSGADLSEARLSGAILIEACLSGADLSRAWCGGASLRGADLRGTILRRAYLGRVDFGGADLSGADFSEAILSDADFQFACILPSDQVPAGWSRGDDGRLRRSA